MQVDAAILGIKIHHCFAFSLHELFLFALVDQRNTSAQYIVLSTKECVTEGDFAAGKFEWWFHDFLGEFIVLL